MQNSGRIVGKVYGGMKERKTDFQLVKDLKRARRELRCARNKVTSAIKTIQGVL